jgi:hypothetical protein
MKDRDGWRDEPLDGALAEAVRGLPREVEPAAAVEERTVKLLRGRGQVGRVRRAIGPAWWAAGLAASLALFASGLVAGQWLGTRQTAAVVAAQQQASLEEIAAAVERTGGEYVSALARLAESDVQNGGGEQARQIVAELRHQYVLAFKASARPGWRPISVQARDARLLVRARTGYSAGGSDRPAPGHGPGAWYESYAALPAAACGAP